MKIVVELFENKKFAAASSPRTRSASVEKDENLGKLYRKTASQNISSACVTFFKVFKISATEIRFKTF